VLSGSFVFRRRYHSFAVFAASDPRIAGGITARTSAHLTAQSDDGFKTVTDARGLEGSKTFYESHAAAIESS